MELKFRDNWHHQKSGSFSPAKAVGENGKSGSNGSSSKTNVLIVDDHPAIRFALKYIIDNTLDLQVCGEASSARDALELIEKKKPDILILDISLDDSHGLELTGTIHSLYPDLAIIIYSAHEERVFAERAFKAGARGYVEKSERETRILDAIRAIKNGNHYLSERMSTLLVQKSIGGSGTGYEDNLSELTDRELQVFQLLGEGKTVHEIGELLHMSRKTVETHRRHIKEKLGFETVGDLVYFAAHWAALQV